MPTGVVLSGVEVYGEYGREDHNWDSRDLFVELDHSASYGVGMRKAWLRADRISALRAELINYQESTLARHRAQGGAFYHTTTIQGHTQRGQLLSTGVTAGDGAGAWSRASADTVSRASTTAS